MINRLNKYYRFVYRKALWQMPSSDKEVYLTFDDGPHPIATPFVLDLLRKHNISATFFCIGRNVKQYPEIFKRILAEGHTVGNHSYNHLNGLKNSNENYIRDYYACQQLYPFKYFRPPYGRMQISQCRELSKITSIVMWSVLTKDYNNALSGEYCLNTIKKNHKAGSIIVFHDSEKALKNLTESLEKSILFLKGNNYQFKSLPK